MSFGYGYGYPFGASNEASGPSPDLVLNSDGFQITEDNKITSIDYNGLSAVRGGSTEIIPYQKVGTQFVARFLQGRWGASDATSQEVQITSTGLTSYTNATVFIVAKIPFINGIFMGIGGTSPTVQFMRMDTSSTGKAIFVGCGSPTIRIDGVAATATTSKELLAEIDNDNFVQITVEGVDLTNFSNLNIGKYAGSTSYKQAQYFEELRIYGSEVPTAAERNVIEAAQNVRRDAANAYTEPTYTLDNDFTIIPDTIDGDNAANTGLAYDATLDEVCCVGYTETGTQYIRCYDATTLYSGGTPTINTTIALGSTTVRKVQGLAVDASGPTYYFLAEDETNSNALSLFKYNRSGTQQDKWDVSGDSKWDNKASLCWHDGKLYYYNETDENVYEWTVTASLTLSDTISMAVIRDNLTPVEGLWIDDDIIIIGEEPAIRCYDRTSKAYMWEIDTGLDNLEGLINRSGDIMINDDAYFHDLTAGGNKLYVYTD